MVPIHASPSWLDLTLTASSTALTTHGGRRRKAHPGPSCGPAGEGDSEMGLRPGGSLPPPRPPSVPSAQQGPGRGAGHAPRCELPAALTPAGAAGESLTPISPRATASSQTSAFRGTERMWTNSFSSQNGICRVLLVRVCSVLQTLATERLGYRERVRSRRPSPGPDRPQGFQSSGRGGDCPSTPNPGLG